MRKITFSVILLFLWGSFLPTETFAETQTKRKVFNLGYRLQKVELISCQQNQCVIIKSPKASQGQLFQGMSFYGVEISLVKPGSLELVKRIKAKSAYYSFADDSIVIEGIDNQKFKSMLIGVNDGDVYYL